MEFVWDQTGNGIFLAYYGKIILMPEILMGSNSCSGGEVKTKTLTLTLALEGSLVPNVRRLARATPEPSYSKPH